MKYIKIILYSLYCATLGITVDLDVALIRGLQRAPEMRKIFKFIFNRVLVGSALIVAGLIMMIKLKTFGYLYILNLLDYVLFKTKSYSLAVSGKLVLGLVCLAGVYTIGFQPIALPIAFILARRKKVVDDRDNISKRLSRSFKINKYKKRGYILVGLAEGKKPVYMEDKRRTEHVEVIGSTGAGKTESVIYTGIKQDIENGKGLLLIDGKGDMLNAITIFEMCKDMGREGDFRLFSVNDVERSGSYNPFVMGSATALKDLIVGAIDWSEIYYKRECEDAVQTMMMVLKEVKGKFCLYDIYRCFDQAILEQHAKLVKDKHNKVFLEDMLGSYGKIYKDIKSIRSEVGLLLKAEFSKLFDSVKPNIDLFDMYENNRIVYFALDVQAYGETSKRLGKVVIQNLKLVSSRIINTYEGRQRKILPVYIDEFQAFATDNFIDILNRTRSAGFAVMIAHQSLGDLNVIAKRFQEQVVENTYYTLVLPVKSPVTAEYMAKVIGTKASRQTTTQIDQGILMESNTGVGSEREVEEFRIHPNVFKSIKRSEGIFIDKEKGALVVKLAHTPASKSSADALPFVRDENRHLMDRSMEANITEDIDEEKDGMITPGQKELLKDLIKEGKHPNEDLDSLTKKEADHKIKLALGK